MRLRHACWLAFAAFALPAQASAADYDSIGDSRVAADITSVALTQTGVQQLTFRINVARHPALKANDVFSLALDVDFDAGTGLSPNGADVAISLYRTGGRSEYVVERCSDTACEADDTEADVVYRTSGPEFTLATSAIGLTGPMIRFAARSTYGQNAAAGARDYAPDNRATMYTAYVGTTVHSTATITGVILQSLSVLLPKAGGIVDARKLALRVTEGARQGVVRPDKLRCTARIGSTGVAPLPGGCRWRIPVSARGKAFVATLTAAFRDDEQTTVFPSKVE